MPAFSLFDGMHIRKNPWRDTAFGKGEFILASDPTGSSEAQQRQQQALAEAAQETYSECSSLDGMARNSCRARQISRSIS